MSNENYWFFFPVMGVEIDESKNSISNPMFGDATLVSREQAVEAAKNSGWPGSSCENLKRDAAKSIHFKTFIAVRRKKDGDSSFFKKARERAHAIASSLHLYHLETCTVLPSIGLIEQRQIGAGIFEVAILVDEKDTGRALSMSAVYDPSSNTVTPKKVGSDLPDLLNQPHLDWLLKQNPKPLAIAKVFQRASNHLVGSINLYGEKYPAQLTLAAFLVLEMLLGGLGSYDDIKRRLSCLLGEGNYEDVYKVGDVFQARNNFVHQGAIPPQALSRVAVGLALATIKFFTSVCLEFKNKNDALHYLDAIGIGDKIKTAHKLKQCIEASVFHSPTGESYPFMKEKRFAPMPWDK